MILKKWEQLPAELKNDEVSSYYNILSKRKGSLILKRAFDIVISLLMLIIFSPLFLVLAIAIKCDSKGPVFYRQSRVTQYGRKFDIHKFRTMVQGSDKGPLVTFNNDSRITKVGGFIRKYRLDEICQLIDVLKGDMTFVGTRPEVPKFVAEYSEEMVATLLLPAGITSLASIYYKDEEKLLNSADDVDSMYVQEVLPGKMYYNLKAIEHFSFFGDIKIMFMTFFAVLGKEYKGDYEGSKEPVSEREEVHR